MINIETALGRAWDNWRTTRETSGYLWFVPQGGIGTLTVRYERPSVTHELACPQNVGWFDRERFMVRMTPVARRLPILAP